MSSLLVLLLLLGLCLLASASDVANVKRSALAARDVRGDDDDDSSHSSADDDDSSSDDDDDSESEEEEADVPRVIVQRGPRGFRGEEGARGPRGPAGRGPTGARGPQGEKGDTGNAGAPGAAGSAGATGATGARGPQGIRGPQGLQGPQGIRGLEGPRGLQGPQGAQGAQGQRGAAGVSGLAAAQFASQSNLPLPALDAGGNVQQLTNANGGAVTSVACDPTINCVNNDCGANCAENVRCRVHRDTTNTVTANRVTTTGRAHAGLSCDLSVDVPAGVIARVDAGFQGQPDYCEIHETVIGSGWHGGSASQESRAGFCPVTYTGAATSIDLVPEISVSVLNGIPTCNARQEITQDFNSEFFARSFGWNGFFFVNDRLQPTFPDFVQERPSTVLDSNSPGAIQVRYYPCSSFVYADTKLGMSGDSHNIQETTGDNAFAVGDTLTASFVVNVPDQDDEADTGSLFVGWFNLENEFESGNWFDSRSIGVRIATRTAGNTYSIIPVVEGEGEEELEGTAVGNLVPGTSYHVALSFRLTSAGAPANAANAQNAAAPFLSDGAHGTLSVTVSTANAVGGPGATFGTPSSVTTNEMTMCNAAGGGNEADGAAPPADRCFFNADLNAFGFYHQDYVERANGALADVDAAMNRAQACWNTDATNALVNAGTGDAADNRNFNLDAGLLGTEKAADIILDKFTYTVPKTAGYPEVGAVKVSAQCAAEAYATG